MDNLVLALATAVGFVVMWCKILGFRQAIKYQVIGDLLITGVLMYVARGTYSGIVLAALAGLFASLILGALKYLYNLKPQKK